MREIRQSGSEGGVARPAIPTLSIVLTLVRPK